MTADQECLDMRSDCHSAKILLVDAVVPGTSGAYVPFLKRSDRTQGTLVSPISMESIDLHMITVITTICSRNELCLSDCCIRTLLPSLKVFFFLLS